MQVQRLDQKSGGWRTAAASAVSAEFKAAILFLRATATALRPRPHLPLLSEGPVIHCANRGWTAAGVSVRGGVQVADIADVQGVKAVREIDSTDPPPIYVRNKKCIPSPRNYHGSSVCSTATVRLFVVNRTEGQQVSRNGQPAITLAVRSCMVSLGGHSRRANHHS